MERNKLVLDLNKNKEFNYIYKLTEEQIFSKLVNLEQLTFVFITIEQPKLIRNIRV